MARVDPIVDLRTQADVVSVAAGIYMQRWRIGLYAALAELTDEATRRGIEPAQLAHDVVGRLDQPASCADG